jgi:NADH:ubiquinone oxidoreductase subunit 6 (subunit J)
MIDLQEFVFYVIACLTGVCALATVVSQNIVRAATWLLFTLAGTSAVFFYLGADFVGAIQLLIYVGGTMVLVVFGVMLTAQGPFISMKTSGAEWAISIVAGIMLFSILCFATYSHSGQAVAAKGGPMTRAQESPKESHDSTTIGQVLMGMPYGPAGAHYLLPFEIVSVHLLVVLIGAAYLARAKRRQEGKAR